MTRLTRHAVMLLVAGALLDGCAKQPENLCPCPEGKALDQELMLVLSTARALHHQADLHLQQGEVESAISAVRAILALKLDRKWPEAEEVRLDATARLAKLLLGRQGEAAEAEALTLVLGEIGARPRESFYLSNLHSVRGEVLETRSKRLEAAGQKDQARQSAREAIAAFEQSITINKRLQQELLRGGGR